MIRQPKMGDRVGLLTRDFKPDDRPGETGTLVSGPQAIPRGGCFSVLTLDKDGPGAAGISMHTG